MVRVLTVIAFAMNLNFALAQSGTTAPRVGTEADIEKARAQIADLGNLTTEMEALSKDITSFNAIIKGTEKSPGKKSEVERAQAVLRGIKHCQIDHQSGCGNLSDAEDWLAREQKWLGEYETKVAAAGTRLGELQKKYGTAMQQVATVAQMEKDFKEGKDKLIGSLATLSAENSFERLDGKLADANDLLNNISDTYDQAMVGVYLKDKIGKLLNSSAFCTAQKTCEGKDHPTVEPTEIEKIFAPTKSKSTRGSAADYGASGNR